MKDITPYSERVGIGRPTLYDEKYCNDIIDFFDKDCYEVIKDRDGEIIRDKDGLAVVRPAKLPTLVQFAKSIGVHRDTINAWEHKYDEFSDAVKMAKALQEDIIIQGGLLGYYDKTFAIFTGKAVCGMRDGGEPDVGKPKPIGITFDVQDARITPPEA